MKKEKNPSPRFFFTATPESFKWVLEEAKRLGLQPSEFLRMLVHGAATKE